MHNLSDQELDRLSKEAAEKYEAAASPALWDKILPRLDAEMPEKKKDKRRFFWLFIFAGLILLSLTVGISVMNNSGKTNAVHSGTSISGLVQSEKIDADYKVYKTQTPNSVEKNDEQAKVEKTVENSFEKNLPPIPEKQRNDKASKAAIRSSNQKITKTTNEEKQAAATPAFFHVPQSKTEKSLANNSAEPAGQTEKKMPLFLKAVEPEKPEQNHINAETTGVPEKTIKGQESAAKTDSAELLQESVASATTSRPTATIPSFKRLEIAAVFGPDFSNVGFVSPEKTGMNIGILVGYRFTKRLSVQTGLLYSQKHYTAVGDAYKKYPGYISGNPNLKMKWVEANCFMWDMPVNIRYDWLLKQKQRAFASVGVSSYFMSKEDLHYYYSYYNDPDYKAWVNEQNSSFWMSALNLSIGFEQRISQVLSIQAEPFMKVPVREIGSGKIELNSFGIFLSLKYSPAPNLFKTKKPR